ncbi:uncharacterized protein LOC110181887 isoform X2 [Drosophila serrata]|uniref:uncharacterized protein LOC110181887 isoform X2 n=1 Tax=Drosophila serrata TaxID=7274 RepID=UPI000A1CFE9D|nr:uncharacterized protein LOC110181887 isoform X2 [Drosophila serrata]
MSVQKVLFVGLLCLLVTLAWSLPTQTLNVTGTTSRKREIVKSFVAEVNALIAKLIRQLQELTAIK